MPKIVFLHPDLGIGGAERAVIDAGLALKAKGHNVEFVTSHYDPQHCFQETRDGIIQVTAVGDWLPRSIFGRCYALCAYIRMIFAAFYLVLFSSIPYDVIFCDQISACVPILRLSGRPIIFYCHFPDLLLTQRQSTLKRLYRAPIDWIEEKTTGMANVVLVNSKFTAGIFKETFKSLSHIEPDVLYPIPNFAAFSKKVDPPTDDLIPSNKKTIFLSINRYERKKNLTLAIQAFAQLKEDFPDNKDIHLIIAGGYDERVIENKEYFVELKAEAEKKNVFYDVTFIRSFSDAQKRILLSHSTCLLYTPDREHFGIVPIESMLMNCPVIAVNSGGPLETVEDNVTGYLCNPNSDDFCSAMTKFVDNSTLKQSLGTAGHKRVCEKFSFDAFANQLHNIVIKLLES